MYQYHGIMTLVKGGRWSAQMILEPYVWAVGNSLSECRVLILAEILGNDLYIENPMPEELTTCLHKPSRSRDWHTAAQMCTQGTILNQHLPQTQVRKKTPYWIIKQQLPGSSKYLLKVHHMASSHRRQTSSTSAVIAHIFFWLIKGKEVRKQEHHDTNSSPLLARLISRPQQQTPPLHLCFVGKRYFMRLSVCLQREDRHAHNADG